jgi:hypothetical protein
MSRYARSAFLVTDLGMLDLPSASDTRLHDAVQEHLTFLRHHKPPHVGITVPRRQTDYTPKLLDLEPLFCHLAQPDIERGTVPRYAQETRILVDTLYSSPRHLIKDPTWRPGSMRQFSHRLLSDAEEAAIATFIRTRFTSMSGYCPPTMMNLVALQISRGAILTEESEEGASPSTQEVDDVVRVDDDPPDTFDQSSDDSDAE